MGAACDHRSRCVDSTEFRSRGRVRRVSLAPRVLHSPRRLTHATSKPRRDRHAHPAAPDAVAHARGHDPRHARRRVLQAQPPRRPQRIPPLPLWGRTRSLLERLRARRRAGARRTLPIFILLVLVFVPFGARSAAATTGPPSRPTTTIGTSFNSSVTVVIDPPPPTPIPDTTSTVPPNSTGSCFTITLGGPPPSTTATTTAHPTTIVVCS